MYSGDKGIKTTKFIENTGTISPIHCVEAIKFIWAIKPFKVP